MPRDAFLNECKRYLPKAEYEIIESAMMPDGGIWQVVSGQGKRGFFDYQVVGHPRGNQVPPEIWFFLLQS
jgi:hypothetical protein